MTHRDFCYWLKGFVELNQYHPNKVQWDEIKEHLEKCFNSEQYYPSYDFPSLNNGYIHVKIDPATIWWGSC